MARKLSLSTLPTWAYGLGAVGVAGAYYLYRRRSASAAATATQTATAASQTAADAGTQAASYGNAGDLAALAPYIQNLQGNSGNVVPLANPNDYIPGAGTRLQGQGYTGKPGQYIAQAATGEAYSEIGTWQTRDALIKSGTPVFYQPAPGIFVPWSEALRRTGTRTYLKVPQNVQVVA